MITNDQVRKWNQKSTTVQYALDGNLSIGENLKSTGEICIAMNLRARTLKRGRTLRIVIAEE